MHREPITASPAPDAAPPAALLEDQLLGVEAALHELRDDPEAVVHDARIALRKLRSTLSLYAPILQPEPARALRRELTWLAGELGPARDAQVLLARMRAAVEDTSDRQGAAELLAVFERAEREAFDLARAALATDRFAALISRLDVARLRSMVVPGATHDGLAGEDLRRLARDLEATTGASDERLHELRKAVKRARYVRGRHDGVDTALKRVQAVLGEHQDSVVAREHLARCPESALRDALVAREVEAGARSHDQLHKAVKALHKAMTKLERREALRSGA